MKSIYIVEDDEDIRELTIYALESAGFACYGFEQGGDFFPHLEEVEERPNIILLDIMLPGEDGISILKKIKEDEDYKDIPIIMLTAKGSEADKVKGLNLGADDYVSKPFGVTELIARIRAVLRRTESPKEVDGILTYKDMEMDKRRRIVRVNKDNIILTFMEFELLYYLLMNVDIVLSRNQLMDVVWGYDYGGESRTVDMHIKSLRQKIGLAGEYIKTVRNVGYKIGE